MAIFIIIILMLITIFTYLIILGSNMSKSDFEKQIEDEEQMEYIKKYIKRRNGKDGRKNK